MKLIDKINKFINTKNKGKVLVKSNFGLPTLKNCFGYITDLAGPSNVDGGDVTPTITFRLKNERKLDSKSKETSSPTFYEIEEIYVGNNEDAKDLILNINGIANIDFGTANQQLEAIRVSYDVLVLDLGMLIKIYSFTSGDKTIFAKDANQKKKVSDILNSMNISSINIVDLVNFE